MTNETNSPPAAPPAPFYQSSTYTKGVQTSAPAPLPDVSTASSAEIMQARREGKIDDINWPRYAARILKEHGSSTISTPSPATTVGTGQAAAKSIIPSAAQMQDLATEGAQSAALEASAYAPAKADDFKSLIDHPDASPAEFALDAEVRTALSHAQFPAHVGNAVTSAVQNTVRELAGANQQRIDKYLGNFNSTMSAQWGDQCAARLKAVDAEIFKVADKSPYISSIINRAPYLLANPMLALQIWNHIEYRNRAQGHR